MEPRSSLPKEKAEHLSQRINELLKGKRLIAIQVIGNELPRVETDVSFEHAAIIDYDGLWASLMLTFKGSVIPGLAEWVSDPSMRSLHAMCRNGPGQLVRFTWVLVSADPREDEKNYRDLKDFQEFLWQQ